MPSVKATYSGSNAYLKADDLAANGPVTLTIKDVRTTNLKGKTHLELGFRETNKKLTLNKVNASSIAKLFGDNTDQWAGQVVTFAARQVEFQGEMVNGIRVDTEVGTRGRVQRPARTNEPKPSAPESITARIVEVNHSNQNGRSLYVVCVDGGERFWSYEDPVARAAKSRCGLVVPALLRFQCVRNPKTGVESFKLLSVEDAGPEPNEDQGPAVDDIPF